jgi:hypothetical protein
MAEKWRVAHLGDTDKRSYDEFVAAFERAYEANNKPEGMAMFSHNDSLGHLMGVSITPQSIPYCPFSADWAEDSNAAVFGNVGWVAGDVRLKQN